MSAACGALSEAARSGPPAELGVAPSRPTIDLDAAARAGRDLLVALGRDPDSDPLGDAPRRMAGALTARLTPKPFDVTTFANDAGYDELVLARDIPFRSLCEHHLLPFHGVAHVGYLPGERILGLSKLAGVVEQFACDLQIQQRLTSQVAGWLQEQLQPKGVGVVLEADHFCMSLRGVRAAGGSHRHLRRVRSAVRDDPQTRQEFFALTGRRQ